MGSCLSKKTRASNMRDSVVSMGTTKSSESSTTNILHNKMGDAISMIVCNHPSHQHLTKSLLIAPPTEEILTRFWIQKKGHIIRTLKKRYCVIEKNDIKYYGNPSPDPPFGKNLKGHISLAGAVCIAEESEDFTSIDVEIFGSLGENDLCFTIDNTEEGKVCLFYSSFFFLALRIH